MALNVLCIWRDRRALHCLMPHCLHVHIGGLRALMGPPRPVEPLEPPLEHPPHDEGPERPSQFLGVGASLESLQGIHAHVWGRVLGHT